MTLRARTAVGEEARAATRAVFGISLGVGGMAAAAAALIGDPLAVVWLPTMALGVAIARRAIPTADNAAAVVWLAFVPRVRGEALLVPLAMSLACLAGSPRALDKPQTQRLAEAGRGRRGLD